MNDRFCTYCGMPLQMDARVCTRCGQPVYGTADEADRTQPGQNVPEPRKEAEGAGAPPEQVEAALEKNTAAEPKATEFSAPQGPAEEKAVPPAPKYMPAGAPPPVYGAPPVQGQSGAPGNAPYPAAFYPDAGNHVWQAPRPELLGLGGCVGMLVVAALPLVGWIMMLVWGFGTSAEPNRRTLARALLIFKGIGAALTVLFWVACIVLVAVTGEYYYY